MYNERHHKSEYKMIMHEQGNKRQHMENDTNSMQQKQTKYVTCCPDFEESLVNWI
jgi:hypothetical protein